VSGDLDRFVARCDDVLTDWDGSADAMHAKALPDGSYQTGPTLAWLAFAPPPIVISAAQARAILAAATEFGVALTRVFQEFARVLNEAAPAFAELSAALQADDDGPADLRDRALWLRQQRNTGPRDPHRLDGTRHGQR
jgi:hypothetical protein